MGLIRTLPARYLFVSLRKSRIPIAELGKSIQMHSNLLFLNIIFSSRVIGYALSYFKSYNNPGSRVLHLEDLYVREPHRSNGVDIKLLETVELFARESGCSWLLHQIMRWNPDVSLYKQIGAVDITATDGWHQFRVTGQTLVELAK